MCIIVANMVTIGQTVSEIPGFNGFQNSGHPLSWIIKSSKF